MAVETPGLRFGVRTSRDARNHYALDHVRDDGLLDGSPRLAGETAASMNAVHDILNHPERAVRGAEIHALITLDAVFREVIRTYERDIEPDAFALATPVVSQALGVTHMGRVEAHHAAQFESDEVLRDRVLATLVVENQAADRMVSLVQPHPQDAALDTAIADYFDTLGRFPGREHSLIEMLFEPLRAVPHSLQGQLEYVASNFGDLLDTALLMDLLRSRDRLAEAYKMGGVGGRPTSEVYTFDNADIERFSPDSDWMPSCVLIAKNTYVWLHQLSRTYGYTIERLDQVPDDELERLARQGMNGLWLIGLWERSDASRRIKQMCGNPDAVSSAYSLYDYRIADELGGQDAYETLKARAWTYGVRLAADMVPNHVGISSKWVIEHPDWFLSVPEPPFPGYTFNGPDLCDDPGVSIHLEDHYFERSDAAVVFKRYDHGSGDERYIYHGNDGTSMPWNDTAQIDYLHPEAREAVIQTILHVARQFPIIRFDAAMTLVKKHIQRLWYPEPGTGGAIPSRADHGITRQELDIRMPKEFWAEVVDRVAVEAPDTLLLAEAFWMLEGYFVRSLGMHRVYNSAFMNMLRDEKNDEYRQLMKNTLEFDPQILKRYVNFMNNPDEETAEAQFGKDDKYFGICTMMATLPGLPMFGHGQVEGFTEKYGMDFRKPLRDEQPDMGFVAYHERRIFPLLHRRTLFAEVDDFRLYDLFTNDGQVDENVFAYSNRRHGDRGLVLYHNRYADTAGWVRTTVGWRDKHTDTMQSSDLAEGLSLQSDDIVFYRFRDVISGMEYLRSSRGLSQDGFYVELGAYDCHVFVDWQEVTDIDGRWAKLDHHLGGRGVARLEDAHLELEYGEVYAALHGVLDAKDDLSRQNAVKLLARRIAEKLGETVDPKRVEAAQDRVSATLERLETAPSALTHDLALIRSTLLSLADEGAQLFDEWSIATGLRERLGEFGGGIMRSLLALGDQSDAHDWLSIKEVQDALRVHRFEGREWFNKEAFDAFIETFPNLYILSHPKEASTRIREYAERLEEEARQADFDFGALVEGLSDEDELE